MSKFFINRPIVAIVISILMVLIGVVSVLGLPTAQFPNIADPMIQVKATYPGADATTIAESVATPIEQQMSGVTGMNYMYSLSASSGGVCNCTWITSSEPISIPIKSWHRCGRGRLIRRCHKK